MTAIAQSLAALTLAFVWAQVTNDPEIAFTMWVGAIGIYCWANTELTARKLNKACEVKNDDRGNDQ